MQKKEKKVMQNYNALKKIKSVLIYTFYRTVNYYNTNDNYNRTNPNVQLGDLFPPRTGGGEFMFWDALTIHIVFVLCTICEIFNITLFHHPSEFIVSWVALIFIRSFFTRKIQNKLLRGFKQWRKENKGDPRWKTKGYFVFFFLAFNLVEFCLIMGCYHHLIDY